MSDVVDAARAAGLIEDWSKAESKPEQSDAEALEVARDKAESLTRINEELRKKLHDAEIDTKSAQSHYAGSQKQLQIETGRARDAEHRVNEITNAKVEFERRVANLQRAIETERAQLSTAEANYAELARVSEEKIADLQSQLHDARNKAHVQACYAQIAKNTLRNILTEANRFMSTQYGFESKDEANDG